ncbi:MAG: GIY-YIG nuclease family protein [Lentisphaeria bacterium]|nr:GIY-YIG nuclease family protein [Lentisphaeria bacterium]
MESRSRQPGNTAQYYRKRILERFQSMPDFHYVYILVDEATGTHFYIGSTEDLKSRLVCVENNKKRSLFR